MSVNTIWRFESDLEKGEFSLTIEYCSRLGPAEHEVEHRRIAEMAAQWLHGFGLDDAECPVKIVRTRLAGQCACDVTANEDEQEIVDHQQQRDQNVDEDAQRNRRAT